MTGYSGDLAYIHDVGFSGYAWSAGPGVLDILHKAGIAGGLVVDLGCGSGIWAARLLGEGYRVVGVDISPSMIRIARRNAPEAKFVAASLLSYELPPCDAVSSLGECINYCFDPANRLADLERLFARVYAALRPGGIFVFDFAEPGQAPPGRMRRSWAAGSDWAVLFEVEEDRKARVMTRRMTSFRKSGSKYRRTDEVHVQRLYRAPDLMKRIREAGFRARLVRSIGSYVLPPAHGAIIGRKPA